MFTDMVGSTASAQADEAEALKLRDEQEELVRPLFVAHQGREIKSMGDGFLAEFDSALRAVQCAIDIQQHLHERNSQPGLTPIQLRIGIHLGDVEQRGNDIFGDAVNIASRIEPLALPRGVCISGEVFSQVRNKIPNKLERLPPTTLKGLQVSIDVYRVVLPWTDPEPPSGGASPTRLAVLPFANMSPDPQDEFFAEGLTEEMITVLSQLRELRVIARTSVSQYKATTKSVSQIGTELGVNALLEGSVRRAGDQLRITVQLIDVGTQEHTWAKTYDRKLDKIFAVQTEIAKRVAKQLKINVRTTEEARLEARPAVTSDSYLAYLKGRALLHLPPIPTSLAAAKSEFERAMALDPNNAAAHSGLADATRMQGWWYPDLPRVKWEETSRQLVKRAIELDPNLAEAHASLGLILDDAYEYAAAEKEFKLALSLNPSYSLAHDWYAGLLLVTGRTEEALGEMALAEEADPLRTIGLCWFAMYLIWLGRFEAARVKIQRLREIEPDGPLHHAVLATYYLAQSDLKACLNELEQWFEKADYEPRWKPILRAMIDALSGEKDRARALLRQEDSLPAHPGAQWIIPSIYCELGDLDESFRWIEKARNFGQLLLDPRCEPIRRDPRFRTLLKKRNLA